MYRDTVDNNIVCCYYFPRSTLNGIIAYIIQKSKHFMSTKKEFSARLHLALTALSVLLILSIGIFFRFFDLTSAPYWMDEGYTINAVLSIQEKGVSVLDSGMPYSCPLYCYPTAFLADTFGNSPSSYRLLSAIAGAVFIPLFFLITRRLFGWRVALLSTFFLSFSAIHIAWAHQARWYTLLTLFFWLALFFLYRAITQKGKTKETILNWALFILFAILATKTHTLAILLFAIAPLWYCILDPKRLLRISTQKVQKPIFLLASFTAVFGILLSTGMLDRAFGILSHAQFHYTLPYYLSYYLTHYWLFLVPFVLAFPLLEKETRRTALLLFVALLVYIIPLGTLSGIVHYRYLFHLTPVFFIFGALAFLAIQDAICARLKSNRTAPLLIKMSSVLLLLPIALFFILGIGAWHPTKTHTLESDSPTLIGARPHIAYTPQPNWNNAYAYIAQHRTAGDIIISSHPHFNKIFLSEAGYWIRYNYLGMSETPNTIQNGREYYVGALVIDDTTELETLLTTRHGFIVFDYMAQDGRITPEILERITTLPIIFHEKSNEFSEVWVFRF